MDILSVDLDKVYLGDATFYGNDPETILHARLLTWRNKFEQCKQFEKDINKELMPVAWHPRRCGFSACQKMRKKK